jgi:dihydroxy-acid dehydratase
MRIDGLTLKEAFNKYDIKNKNVSAEALDLYGSAPEQAGRNLILGSHKTQFSSLDTDREKGCVRDIAHCYNPDGGLAVLFGNIAQKGSIVKTAGVDPSIFKFNGKAKVFNSQDESVEAIIGGKIKSGDVVVIRYEGPKGGPGMQEMLYPTSYLKSMKLGKECALITDGRFSGGTAGLSIGHISPEAAGGGNIALIKDGDVIEINIPERKINLLVSNEELESRKKDEIGKGRKAYKPEGRNRKISDSLKTYSMLVSSADTGAVRILPEEI